MKNKFAQLAIIFVLAVALFILLLLFVFPTSNKWLGPNLAFLSLNSPSSNANLSTAFECPTAVPQPLTRYPRPTIAPPPTTNAKATPRPTRPPKTRIPRPTAAPTPTTEFLTADGPWKKYQDAGYDFSFEYPATWFIQKYEPAPSGVPDIRAWTPGTFVNVWNFSQFNAPAIISHRAIGIYISLSPALCENRNLEQALVENQGLFEVSPLNSHSPVGGYPAWQHTIESTAGNSTRWLEVVIPRGKWVYRIRVTPADSTQLSAFEHLLETFTTP